jgi:hypothetical protein
MTEQQFRTVSASSALTRTEALDFMIDSIKDIALKVGRMAQAAQAASPESEEKTAPTALDAS